MYGLKEYRVHNEYKIHDESQIFSRIHVDQTLCSLSTQIRDNFSSWSDESPVRLVLGPRVPCFLVLFDLMITLQSTETHNITLKNLTLFRLKLCAS